jgi:hypothetical protein
MSIDDAECIVEPAAQPRHHHRVRCCGTKRFHKTIARQIPRELVIVEQQQPAQYFQFLFFVRASKCAMSVRQMRKNRARY